jgi:hypothetical protein
MDLLVRGVRSANVIIRSLLDLVNLDQMGSRETLQVICLLSDVVPGSGEVLISRSRRKGVRLAYTIPDSCLRSCLVLEAVADGGLIHNGVKFTPLVKPECG